MRQLLVLALSLLLSLSPAWGTISLLGQAKAQAATSGTATTSSQDTTGAKLIVVAALGYSIGSCRTLGAAIAETDSKGNTWNVGTNRTNSNANICLIWTIPTSVGTGHTFSLASAVGGSYPSELVSWWGATGTISVDQSEIGAGSATSSVQPGSLTPSVNNTLIFTAFANGASVATASVDSSFVAQDSYANNSFATGAWAYLLQGSAAAVNPTWSNSTSGVAASMMNFKEVTAAPKIRHRVARWSPIPAPNESLTDWFGRMFAA